jgi:hypothetical protein
MKPAITFITATFLCLGVAYAQESVNSSGGNASGSGGSVAYSIGQVVYTTNSSSSGSSAQGVQHAYEIFTVGIPEVVFNFSITAFPNPTVDQITLQLSETIQEPLSYQLFDMQGRMLTQSIISEQHTVIDMKSLAKASYFIHVVNHENKKVQTFKIVKN